MIVSMEMRRQQLARRLMCSEAGIDTRLLRSETPLEKDDLARLWAACDQLQGLPLFIWSPIQGVTIDQIRSKARAFKAREGAAVLVIDYLQLVEPLNPQASVRDQVSMTSRKAKQVAEELGVVLLLLCQLNRATDHQERPTLNNLRDSSAIESDADIVLLLHRVKDDEGLDTGVIELNVAKGRDTASGAIARAVQPDDRV